MYLKITIYWLIQLLIICETVIVTIPDLGKVQGKNGSTTWTGRIIYQFYSIKYAESPSGLKRFMPPEPIKPWNGTFNATVPGIHCPQMNELDALLHYPPNTDVEDCLSMNVFTPIIPDSGNNKKLPVMVYIHGGAYLTGNAQEFPPNYLLENDVLLVVIQYRLGPIGFLSLHTDGMPGNAGMFDQLLALKWVNKNIEHFGGDNTKVTIFGQSAGACSVSLLLVSPLVEPHLFQQAIVQSGSSYAKWFLDDEPTGMVKDIYKVMTNNSHNVDVSVIENTMKTSSVYDILSATVRLVTIKPSRRKSLGRIVIQKAGTVKFLTQHPNDIVESGKYKSLPMMIGATKDDGSFLLPEYYDVLEMHNLQNDDFFLRNGLTNFTMTAVDIFDNKFRDYTDSLAHIIEHIYYKKAYDLKRNITFRDIAPGLIDITGVFIIKGQVLKQAKINTYYNAKTYLYTLDYKGEYTRFGFGVDTSKYPFDGGVHHSNDLLYLFPFPYKNLNKKDTKMAKLMTDLWANFAIHGEPKSKQLDFKWPTMIIGKNGPYLHLNATLYVDDDFVNNEFGLSNNAIKNDVTRFLLYSSALICIFISSKSY